MQFYEQELKVWTTALQGQDQEMHLTKALLKLLKFNIDRCRFKNELNIEFADSEFEKKFLFKNMKMFNFKCETDWDKV